GFVHNIEEYENSIIMPILNFQNFFSKITLEPEYDLIKIKLNQIDGNLNGKPFYFNFVRENRVPVLQYIDKVNIPDTRKYAFTFKAVDPDEDNLRIIPTTYDKIDITSITPDTTEKNKWIVAFESNIGKFNTETIRLDVCDSMYCDYQTIELRQE
ncbi:hypothetical protein KY334_05045, partial [Candidatus Woesearchaeota archaeon]|nr:hypothetical protein [Candidatus Woesearchaeota archaeon]